MHGSPGGALEDRTIPLNPALYLERAASVFPNRLAIVDDDRSFTYAEFASRGRRLAAALRTEGIAPGHRVAALCANSHVMLEMHNALPMSGGVLVPVNTRLAVDEISYILEHSEADLVVATADLAEVGALAAKNARARLVVADGPHSEYEDLIAAGSEQPWEPVDERSMLAINYTSGSTGRPKGVMYNHRGAYLQALAMLHHCGFDIEATYLWTLPMFHCDGWCLPWAVTAGAGVHHCLRTFDAESVWDILREGRITHMSGAPTVLTMVAQAAERAGGDAPLHPIKVTTGGAPPAPALLARLLDLNMHVTHLYGLTETYGPAVVNVWQPEWNDETPERKAVLNARQGISNVVTMGMRVVDDKANDVPPDGETLGEVLLRGNNVMIGYYRDDKATEAAFIDGWFRTGDLGVLHPDGYVELRDRAKDIIITGGENVASIEVEKIIAAHPAVLEVAVVARPDEVWGEVPIAFVTLRSDMSATDEDIIGFVRERAARFKAPREVRFEELPKTATGKVQKHVLRARLTEDRS